MIEKKIDLGFFFKKFIDFLKKYIIYIALILGLCIIVIESIIYYNDILDFNILCDLSYKVFCNGVAHYQYIQLPYISWIIRLDKFMWFLFIYIYICCYYLFPIFKKSSKILNMVIISLSNIDYLLFIIRAFGDIFDDQVNTCPFCFLFYTVIFFISLYLFSHEFKNRYSVLKEEVLNWFDSFKKNMLWHIGIYISPMVLLSGYMYITNYRIFFKSKDILAIQKKNWVYTLMSQKNFYVASKNKISIPKIEYPNSNTLVIGHQNALLKLSFYINFLNFDFKYLESIYKIVAYYNNMIEFHFIHIWIPEKKWKRSNQSKQIHKAYETLQYAILAAKYQKYFEFLMGNYFNYCENLFNANDSKNNSILFSPLNDVLRKLNLPFSKGSKKDLKKRFIKIQNKITLDTENFLRFNKEIINLKGKNLNKKSFWILNSKIGFFNKDFEADFLKFEIEKALIDELPFTIFNVKKEV